MIKEKSKFIPFPMILHGIIEMCEANNFEDIISWQPHGLAFKIRKPKKFREIILPIFFKHQRLKSFMRQLYYYSFQRITNGEDLGCYHHKKFVRQEKSWARGIIRSTRKGNDKTPSSHTVAYVHPEFIGRDHKYGIHKVETSSYVNEVPVSYPNTNMTLNGSQTNVTGLLDNKDFKLIQESADNTYYKKISEQTLNVTLENRSCEVSKTQPSTLLGEVEEVAKAKETEVDLYSPNLEQTSIFMETVEDDLEFSLVLQSLRLMLQDHKPNTAF